MYIFNVCELPTIILYNNNKNLEKKYAPTLDNYGQSCVFKNEVCLLLQDTNDAPV
jgi:hypothetical protein